MGNTPDWSSGHRRNDADSPNHPRYTRRTPSSSSDITPVATFYGCRRIYGIGLSLEGGDNPYRHWVSPVRMNDAWLDQESIIIHTCSCCKRLTATEGEYSAVCSTIMQYSFSLFGNTRLTLSHHAPVPALDNAACSPLPGPPLVTVISASDSWRMFNQTTLFWLNHLLYLLESYI